MTQTAVVVPLVKKHAILFNLCGVQFTSFPQAAQVKQAMLHAIKSNPRKYLLVQLDATVSFSSQLLCDFFQKSLKEQDDDLDSPHFTLIVYTNDRNVSKLYNMLPSLGKPKLVLFERYVPLQLLAEGTATATCVHLALDLISDELVVMKQIAKFEQDKLMRDCASKEIKILSTLKHPNIIQLLDGPYSDESHMYLIFEYCAGGSLSGTWQNDHATFEEDVARQIIMQVVDALEYLHTSMNIVHRDLSLENICLSHDNTVKLIDFGMADHFTPHSASLNLRCGRSCYQPAEMLMGKSYIGPEIDKFALGVVLFKLVTGYFPFSPYKHALEETFAIPLADEPISNECKDLLCMLLNRDATKRGSWQNIKQHAWLSQQPCK